MPLEARNPASLALQGTFPLSLTSSPTWGLYISISPQHLSPTHTDVDTHSSRLFTPLLLLCLGPSNTLPRSWQQLSQHGPQGGVRLREQPRGTGLLVFHFCFQPLFFSQNPAWQRLTRLIIYGINAQIHKAVNNLNYYLVWCLWMHVPQPSPWYWTILYFSCMWALCALKA